MSRIGRLPIKVPKDAKVAIDGDVISVQGPKGKLERKIHQNVKVEMDGDTLKVIPLDKSRTTKALHGLTRALIANMVHGVTKGFTRELIVTGVGYKVDVKGKSLILNLGFSHPIDFPLPDGVTAKVDSSKELRIILESPDKELLGLTASRIRAFRPPEPYKGKGVQYSDEVIIRKAGKAAAK